MGEGALRKDLERVIREKGLMNVDLIGFKNQTEIPLFYTMADVLVMTSGLGETWGLVVNEGMNFHLPLIASDMAGCTPDLVRKGENGYVFEVNNITDLRDKLSTMINQNTKLKQMGERSAEIIRNYSFAQIRQGIRQSLEDTKLRSVR